VGEKLPVSLPCVTSHPTTHPTMSAISRSPAPTFQRMIAVLAWRERTLKLMPW
jgi:hypothetical protein